MVLKRLRYVEAGWGRQGPPCAHAQTHTRSLAQISTRSCACANGCVAPVQAHVCSCANGSTALVWACMCTHAQISCAGGSAWRGQGRTSVSVARSVSGHGPAPGHRAGVGDLCWLHVCCPFLKQVKPFSSGRFSLSDWLSKWGFKIGMINILLV